MPTVTQPWFLICMGQNASLMPSHQMMLHIQCLLCCRMVCSCTVLVVCCGCIQLGQHVCTLSMTVVAADIFHDSPQHASLTWAVCIRLAAKQVDAGGAAAPHPPSGSTPAGHDDGLGPILPDFGSLLHADKPDARRLDTGLIMHCKTALLCLACFCATCLIQVFQDCAALPGRSAHQ